MKNNHGARRRVSRLRAGSMLLAIMVGSACNTLLDVDVPGSVPVETLDSPLLATTLVNGALGEFECAYGNYVTTTAVLSAEVLISGVTIGSNIWGRRWRADILNVSGTCGGYGYFAALQRARYMAQDATTRITGWADADVPGKASLLATLAAYEGYTYLLLGEGLCNAAVNEGPLQTRAQMYAKAEAIFTTAMTGGTTADSLIRRMATVGRARARLNLGRASEAATDAATIPTTFVRTAGTSATTARRYNRMFEQNVTNRDITVAPLYRGLTVGGSNDTRVVATNTGLTGGDANTPQWNQSKYSARNTPIPIASYDEAQLIIAEANVGLPAAETAINNLRTRASLPTLAPGTVVDLPMVLEERRRELFLEGARYNDMLRYPLLFPFPTGLDHKGQIFGDVTCLPMPLVETQNNPSL